MHKYLLYIIVLTLQFTIGCSTNNTEQSDQLYYDIGEQPGIEKLVNAFIKKIAKDEIILPYFAKSSVKHFKKGFVNHLCAVVQGPCQYEGDTMRDIHTGMHISEKDFNRVVELLVEAMEEVGISYRSQNQILYKLAALREQVIKI